MSLLNEMLRDLHHRHALPAGRPSGVMAGVTTLEEADADRRSGFSRQWLVFPVFAVAAVAAGYTVAPRLPGKAPATISQTVAGTQTGLPTPTESVSRPASGGGYAGMSRPGSAVSLRMGTTLGSSALPRESVPLVRDWQTGVSAAVEVLDARLTQSDREATVVLELDRSVEFRVFALGAPPRLVLDIPQATGAVSTAGMVQGHGPVERVRSLSRGEDFRLVLDLAAPVSIRRSALQENSEGGHRLTVELTPVKLERVAGREAAQSPAVPPLPASPGVHETRTGVAGGPVAGSMAKTVVTVDRREVAQSQYRKATRLLNAGRDAAGEAQLRAALTTDATHGKAREILASRWISQRRYEEADGLLREGLTLRAADVRLHRLYARLLVERGDPEQAIAVLQRLSPPLADEPEYHALRAALLRKTGRYGQAAELYRNLVLVRPEAGVWWMGLAMALDANGESKQALEAYDRASGQPDMSDSLVRFIKARMQRLQAQPS